MLFSTIFLTIMSFLVSTTVAQTVEAGTLLPQPAGTGSMTASGNFTVSFDHTYFLDDAGHLVDLQPNVTEPQSAVCEAPSIVLRLDNGILTDERNEIGGIVANRQFQFDGPPSQAGTIYNGGFNLMSDSSSSSSRWVAIGTNEVWWLCNSGGFANIYDMKIGDQCRPAKMHVIDCLSL